MASRYKATTTEAQNLNKAHHRMITPQHRMSVVVYLTGRSHIYYSHKLNCPCGQITVFWLTHV